MGKPIKTLAQTNRFYKDPVERRRRIEQSVYESSFVEGATQLVRLNPLDPVDWPRLSDPEINEVED